MTFSSPYFWLFLLVILSFHYVVPHRWRWGLLLGSSYLFYWWQAPYLVVILLAVTFISYVGGIKIADATADRQAKLVFYGAVLLCVLLLALLKYGAAGILPWPTTLHTIVIVGVSYYTFQAIGYLADIYLGLLKPERHCGYYALSLAFFPKVLQGPIERGDELIPQLRAIKEFDYQMVRSGLLLFAWGLFQKVVIADRLGMYVDSVYNDIHSHSGVSLLLGTYGYAGQIYFDFAGYTSMALGAGRLFGVSLSPNFNQPYLATSVADFWRRWHITFSRWILDYIFKPLQLSWRDYGIIATMLALLVTFLVSGVWHGVSYGFVIWGGLHGCYMASSVLYRPLQKKIHGWLGLDGTLLLKIWQIFFTFHLVCLAWVFFRANSVADAIYLLQHLWPMQGGHAMSLLMAKGDREWYITATILLGLCLTTVFPSLRQRIEAAFNGNWRWVCYYLLVMTLFICGIFHQGAFLYGRF